ncbi:MAG: cell division protein SepF [Promethearchaeati archaeon]
MVSLFGKKNDDLAESPKETLGFTKDLSSVIQDFLIKKYDLSNLNQIEDIKQQLMNRRVLIINAQKILDDGKIQILDLKRAIDDLKKFLRQNGGSLGRIGDKYLILTPNSHIRISN